MAPKSKRARRGFTLIEVTIAILILASGLVILLGLQSSSVERAVRDRDKLQAMLLAREILAAVESSKDPIEVQDRTTTAADILEDLLPGSQKPAVQDEQNKFRVRFRVQNWELPNIDQQLIRRLDLVVSWSDSPLDSISIIYFLPEEPADNPDDTPD